LPEKKIEYIKNFVKNGGNLISSFETSLYDGDGKRLNDFQLSDIFGVNFNGKIFLLDMWDYIYPVNQKTFFKGITKKFLPSTECGIEIKVKTGNPLIYFYEKLKGCYDGIPKVSNLPFLILNKYGKGNSIYIAGNFGGTYYKYRFPEYKLLVKNICDSFSKRLIKIEDEWVEAILREKDNKIYLHLINLTTGLKRPITYIKKIENLKIDIFLKFKFAKTIFSNKKIKIEKHKDFITFTLSEFYEYEVICFEK